jgi:pimeloyl-ACP methyl ester carboxylesterase
MSERTRHPLRLTTTDGFTLRGHLSSLGTVGSVAVLFVHGFGSEAAGNKSQAVEAVCAVRGWTFAAVNLRGHGSSDGTLADLGSGSLLTDLEAIRVCLAGQGVKRLFLVGSSMGGFASAWFALRQPEVVIAVALIAPALGFLRGIMTRVGDEVGRAMWRQTGRLPVRNEGRGTDEELSWTVIEECDQYSLDELVARWRLPALVFHSLRDETVPAQVSIDFVSGVGVPAVELRLYADGDHRDPTDRDVLAAAVGDFFARYWPGA